ncbi:MAG: hypothetical protein ACRDF9_07195 [Candidatus Limnocylindria bacterium]
MGQEDQVFEWDARGPSGPDIGTVDRLCKMALTARRLRRRFRVLSAPRELSELVELCGLTEVVPCAPGSGRETVG